MNQKNQYFPMVAKTLSGLEDILADELTRLGAKRVRTSIRSVEFEGDTKILYKANLWCRTATRILKPIMKFHAIDGEQLYTKIGQINWNNIFNVNKTIAVDALSTYSKLDNTLFVAQKTKDAIVDQFRKKMDKRPSVDTKNPDIKINIHIIKNDVHRFARFLRRTALQTRLSSGRRQGAVKRDSGRWDYHPDRMG